MGANALVRFEEAILSVLRGVRSPYLDVPTATYFESATPVEGLLMPGLSDTRSIAALPSCTNSMA
jgi:hypothetical protein